MWSARAVLGTPEAFQYLLDEYKRNPRPSLALESLAANYGRIGSDLIKDEIYAAIIINLKSDHSGERQATIQMVGSTFHARFIPVLEEIARNDQTFRPNSSGGTAYEGYFLRREAKRALANLR